jgi:hypothetical protein
MPEIAFDPDINGVWSVGGTLLIISKPVNDAKTKTNKAAINASVMKKTPFCKQPQTDANILPVSAVIN